MQDAGTRLRANTKFRETSLAFLISLSDTECLLLDASRRPLSRNCADPWTGSNFPEDGASSSVNTVSISFLRRPFRFTPDPTSALPLSPAKPATFSGIIDSDTRPDTRSRFVILIEARKPTLFKVICALKFFHCLSRRPFVINLRCFWLQLYRDVDKNRREEIVSRSVNKSIAFHRSGRTLEFLYPLKRSVNL